MGIVKNITASEDTMLIITLLKDTLEENKTSSNNRKTP
jgi:hypothetical protein